MAWLVREDKKYPNLAKAVRKSKTVHRLLTHKNPLDPKKVSVFRGEHEDWDEFRKKQHGKLQKLVKQNSGDPYS